MVARARRYGRTCVSCSVPMLPVARVSDLPDWARRHRGRGLCDSCYSAAARRSGRKRATRRPQPPPCPVARPEPVSVPPLARLAAVAGRLSPADIAEYDRATAFNRRCQGCAATLTPSKTRLPKGLKRHRGQGFCNACYLRERARGSLAVIATKVEAPSKCVGCQRKLITPTRRRKGESGVVHRARGRCAMCCKRAERGRKSEQVRVTRDIWGMSG